MDCNFGPGAITGGMRDGATVNGTALSQLKFFYADLFDVVRFPHSLDNVGSHFEFQVLVSYVRVWIKLQCQASLEREKWTVNSSLR